MAENILDGLILDMTLDDLCMESSSGVQNTRAMARCSVI